ncbi:ribonuclease Y [Candidatus Phytoplasma melaleucae]|uniref:Ribonuclease Y n=1 Tax=Candidatus Phytoplasma melaleucae TaxID=2982630 RepID=A0ABT9DFH8_9MOLU|nr:ribonuclease Y ['Melaleuca sp.' phytoplasma]MDO8168070.1 ribonuclease Y ['Melaleuca sp.' phytoplasma]MDV3205351.1 ribonuclease Y [Weeping tea tree witches'-broom phytoplasma]
MSGTLINKWFLALFLFFPLILTIIGFFYYFLFHYQRKIKEKLHTTDQDIKNKILQSQIIAQKIISESKKEIYLLKKEVENDLNQRRKIIVNLEEKIIHKEELLNSRTKYLNDKEELLYFKEQKINNHKENIEQLQSKIQTIINQQQKKLEEIASLTKQQAKNIIMEETKKDTTQEIMYYIKTKEEECKFKVKKQANTLLVSTMQQLSRKISSEHNMDIIYLENNDLKGRIIGKEGRNIKTFEVITGVDLIVDDVPNTVILSSFDPIRREIAKRTLDHLISDGRITPTSIENTFAKMNSEIDNFIQEIGEEAILETKIGFINEELIKLLGKLNFRTSYGQNILKHSLEVAFLAGKLAAEIGENEILARRAGLLHDIGKALDYQIEGSHVKIGFDLAIKYKEPKEVIDAIASHHEDQEPSTIIAVLVAIADSISSSRPGARNESIENYIQRINQLEEIANNIVGVDKSYAIRSGREIRVIVKPEKIDDLSIFIIAQQIKDKITNHIKYNGSIKITVIREVRATEIFEVNS